MIIFNDHSIQTRSDKPNEDWTNGNAKYVVDDNSELATLILATANWTAIEDTDGSLIGITPIEVPTPAPTAAEQIAALKTQLADTDYIAIKYAEGWLTSEEYAATKAQRQAWRDQINALESEVDG